MRILGAAGVPAGAVLETQESHDEESFGRRGIMHVMQHPAFGAFKMPTWPVRHDGATPTLRPARNSDQHTDDVLGDWLGLAILRAEGAI
jgi:crotonobetainyl-CoA:carnitine CoA-transferase CaiB-like acyl-CoA transferase